MLLIPFDSRPVNYDLPQQLAKAGGFKLALPPKEMLGGLDYQADFGNLREWTQQTIRSQRVSNVIVALDTIAYGGLIPSRWSEDYYDDIIARLNGFFQTFKAHNVNVHAYSSIMRVLNDNNNEEEKDYWIEYGKKLYQYSNLYHKAAKLENEQIQEMLDKVVQEIPQEILEDYISTRERNFAVNQYYLEKLKYGHMEQLIFCYEGNSKWGTSNIEIDTIKNLIMQNKLQNKALIHAGCDEVGASLVVKSHLWPSSLAVYPVYTTEDSKEIIANDEDKAIKKSVEAQIKLIGAKKSNSIGSADVVLVVHAPEIEQGDHIEEYEPDGINENALSKLIGMINSLNKPITIADIMWSHGSDPDLIDKLLEPDANVNNIYGYASFKTATVSIGLSLAIGAVRAIGENNNTFNKLSHKRLILKRIIEDWAYATKVRNEITEETLTSVDLTQKLNGVADKMFKKFDFSGEIAYNFHWNRPNEIEITIN